MPSTISRSTSPDVPPDDNENGAAGDTPDAPPVARLPKLTLMAEQEKYIATFLPAFNALEQELETTTKGKKGKKKQWLEANVCEQVIRKFKLGDTHNLSQARKVRRRDGMHTERS